MDKIDGKVFKGMLESGCNNLNGRRKDVDALNVFPVPDGDTGTNMSLTFTNGINEVHNSGSDSLPVVAKTLSRGLLMGARGNSGVILSQIFRGFYQYIGDKEELTVKEYADALLNGSKLAYKAVMRPVEGTILTVIREASETCSLYLEKNADVSIESFMEMLCKEAKASLDRTPELLPVLKEAHVVDSGGAGLVIIFEGFKAFLDGNPITSAEEAEKSSETKNEHASGYRTEFILDFDEKHAHGFNEDRFRKSLEQLGNKLTLLADEKTIKVRVNTMTPGEVLMLAERYGSFRKVQIESVQDDMNDSIIDEDEVQQPAEAKEYGLIAVAAGDGLKKLFTDYRADVVVSGGQTMNPSTEDIVSAIKKVNAKHIYILPNNVNIIMAANQAASVTEGKDVIVLPTKSVPEGLSACINFNPDEDAETNTAAMKDAISHVKTGSITYAVKDTTVDGKEIHSGDFMAICGKEIVYTSKDKVDATKQLITTMCDDDSEIVTIIKGSEATNEESEEIKKFTEDSFEVDVDLQDGGQPVYSFFIGVE
ncbi:MAG: DAK2 domain-containing protein [Erysipelotrichaceae bacterium]|jgi:DAK2 domain fusion protein YloV|nr:DAK2 domain-containing protein [Erysipelotrichaceae bacterium]